jgi:hypothetical protein
MISKVALRIFGEHLLRVLVVDVLNGHPALDATYGEAVGRRET